MPAGPHEPVDFTSSNLGFPARGNAGVNTHDTMTGLLNSSPYGYLSLKPKGQTSFVLLKP